MPRRRIAHLDMDAFYASVELLRYPELRGRPVAIGGRSASAPKRGPDGQWQFSTLSSYAGRGVLTTATYEARALGVRSAMPTMKAAQLAPDAVLLPVDFEAYKTQSRRFKAAVREIAPILEDRGIDEIYLDLTDHPLPDRELAQALKDAVHNATQLSCSIAIAPNKLLAKIGSDLDKPNGLTLLSMEDVPTRIWPLPVGRINGVGPRAQERLTRLGISTIGALAQAPLELLQEHFGLRTARWMHESAHGRDERPVVTHSDPKSISRETTFERDLHVHQDRAELSERLRDLCLRLQADLERKQVWAQTIGVKVRFADFHIVTRDFTLPRAIQSADDLRAAARESLKRIEFAQRIRLLGVRASGLVAASASHTSQQQISLFPEDTENLSAD